jgi:hypothetical protein
MDHMQRLTLASAKHLLNQGHLTPQQHAKIVASVGGKKAAKPQPAPFGRLSQQAPQSNIGGFGRRA